MQNTTDETMIPKVIPSGATIYHKYGILDDSLHDTAIVDYQNKPFVLTIYTKSNDGSNSDTDYRRDAIKQLATSVFQTIYK